LSLRDPWKQLGIVPTDDGRTVKRAYARALKTIDVDADPGAFIRLREAMEAALSWGVRTPFFAEPEDGEWLAHPSDEMVAQSDCETIVDEESHDPLDFDPRPARMHSGDDRLESLRAELEQLLFGDLPPERIRIEAVGREILSHPALAAVDCLVEVEQWLMHAIASAMPRSDPLIEPATARFAWRSSGRDWKRSWALQHVLQRRRDLAFLADCDRPLAQHRVALNELRSPPRRRLSLFKLGLAGQVTDFLRLVEVEHPTIEHDFDPEALAWWRDTLAGPRLPADFWPAMIGVPIALSFCLWLLLAEKQGGAPSLALVYPFALAATFMAMLVDARLRGQARRRALAFPAGSRFRTLWPFAVVLALPPAAALLPDGLWTIFLATGAAAAGALLLLSRLWIVRSERSDKSRYFLPLLATILSVAIVVYAPPGQDLRMIAPLSGMCWVGLECGATIERCILGARKIMRDLAVAALLLILGTAALLLAHGFPKPHMPLWLLALAPVAVTAGQLGAPLFVPSRWPQLLARISWIALVIASNFGFAGFDYLYLGGALIALACAALRVAGALRMEWS
jgi:hypothetical protein